MGANFDSVTVKGCSEQDLRKQFSEIVQECQIQDGIDPYSGSFGTKNEGVVVHHKTFSTESDAEEYLHEEADLDKWGPAIAVKVKVPKAATQKRVETLRKKIRELQLKNGYSGVFEAQGEREIYAAAVERAKSAKSKTTTCKACGSQIAREYIRSHECPVCRNKSFILTKADQNKLDRLRNQQEKACEKVKEMESQIRELIKKDDSTAFVWFIGAMCPS